MSQVPTEAAERRDALLREEIIALRHSSGPVLSVYRQQAPGPSVLFIHGATFPTALSFRYRIDGQSWADDLQGRGFDCWSFDLAGYGASEKPASMFDRLVCPEKAPGRASDVAPQIERVVRYILETTGRPNLSIIAHSWGTVAAGLFAGRHSNWIERLILFGPVAERKSREEMPSAAVRLVTAADQWRAFQSGVPADRGSPIARQIFDRWAEAYLASDAASSSRAPPSVAVPSGPEADFADAWTGRLPYDPSTIRCPTMIVRGEWDAITSDHDAAWLTRSLSNALGGARDVRLPGGAHRMHLEERRQSLFEATASLLEGTAS